TSGNRPRTSRGRASRCACWGRRTSPRPRVVARASGSTHRPSSTWTCSGSSCLDEDELALLGAAARRAAPAGAAGARARRGGAGGALGGAAARGARRRACAASRRAGAGSGSACFRQRLAELVEVLECLLVGLGGVTSQ